MNSLNKYQENCLKLLGHDSYQVTTKKQGDFDLHQLHFTLSEAFTLYVRGGLVAYSSVSLSDCFAQILAKENERLDQEIQREIYENRQSWIDEGERLFGKNHDKWVFVCPHCEYEQSVESVQSYLKQEISRKVKNSLHRECAGNFVLGVGCDLTLRPDLRIHEAEVVYEGKNMPVFKFGRPLINLKDG